MSRNVTALVTLYFPTEKNVENMKLLEEQVDRIILMDNSPNDNQILFKELNKGVYIANKRNLGLSAAFNIALTSMSYKDDEYIVFFDQDSVLPDNYVQTLVHFYEQIAEQEQIGCLGPQYIDTNTNKIISPRYIRKVVDNCYEVSSMITSGLLTQYRVLKDINFWNDDVFLDMADWDFCWRIRERGYSIVLCDAVTLIHTLGKGIKKIGPLKLRNNHPVREYYQIRDCIKLIRKEYVPWKYKVRFLIMLYIMPILYVLFLSGRRQRIKYIKCAFIDGHRRTNGSYELCHSMENSEK